MNILCNKIEALIRQECPEELKEIKGEDRFKELSDIAFKNNLYVSISEPTFGEAITTKYLEKAKEEGYSGVFNDGKLLGFRKEKVL